MALGEAAAPAVTDERKLAAQLFNDTQALLEKEHRTPEDDDRMVHMAHASRFHGDNVGDDQNRAIGEWQVARVYSVLGRGEPALFHARRCLDYASRPVTARRSRSCPPSPAGPAGRLLGPLGRSWAPYPKSGDISAGRTRCLRDRA